MFYDPRGIARFENLASMGILAVEMEAAGLYGVAAEYEAEADTEADEILKEILMHELVDLNYIVFGNILLRSKLL